MDKFKDQIASFKDDKEKNFPTILLREKLTEKAFTRRACFQHFSYEDNPFKVSGQVEYRPAKVFPSGTIYLGQWLVGT